MDYFTDECLRLIDELTHAAIRNEPYLPIRQQITEYLESRVHVFPITESSQPAERQARILELVKELNQLQATEVEYQKTTLGSELIDECKRIKAEGRLINAITYYRDNAGVSLMDAKYFVERF